MRYKLNGVIIGGGILLCVVYYFVEPTASVWLPKCPVYMFTGWECPSCGAQRAFHSVLHLRWREAVMFNPFLLISLPYFLIAIYTFIIKGAGAGWLRALFFGRRGVSVYLFLWCLWGVVRNLLSF
ncbi:MAG: DUF2752 domain-containing protein [Muribaculaceae bacterium]|nr:DUF2752 domain-containing protein [Muribaculaceae bacterium]